MTTRSTKKLSSKRGGWKNVKPRRRMNAKKAVRTDRGRVKGMGGWG
jgi:hypothetical protein